MQDLGTEGRDRRLITTILVLAAVALFFVVIGQLGSVFFYFGDILLTFFLAWLLAFIISPIVARMVDVIPRLPRALATVLVYTGAVAILVVIVVVAAGALATSIAQLVTSLPDIRANLPEISRGSYAGLAVREFVSVAGSSKRSDIRKLQFEPQLNIVLPDRWLLNFSPECAYNLETDAWFVPLDIMVGKKFGTSWVASLEYQYGLVTEDDSYNQWVEARVGYFF